MSSSNNRGSLWSKWDLHFHTPASYDYQNKSVTCDEIVSTLIGNEIAVVAITDHHNIDVQQFNNLKSLGEGKITFLPGIELRDDHGGQSIHYICIFPENIDVGFLWTKLQGNLGLTAQEVIQKGGDTRVYVPIEDASAITLELGGIISIHAGSKTNSIEAIPNTEEFQQRIKYDITQKYVSLMEIGKLKDIDIHRNIIFPKIGLMKPLIIGSDNHSIRSYKVKIPTWVKADPTFNGLLMVLQEPNQRVYIGDLPPDISRWKNNPTIFIDKIIFHPKDNLPQNQKWFSDEVVFNPGLVAIIGNKGSGKSALSDTIGLLGSSKFHKEFSFLHPARFKQAKNNMAQYFDASLIFASGNTISKNLNDTVNEDDVELVKYLPQDYIEKLCTEIYTGDETSFEAELKSVIYSHVPKENRLGQTSLDELIEFTSSHKYERIQTLINSIETLSRIRAQLDSQSEPSYVNSIKERIKKKRADISAHDAIKPSITENPQKSSEMTEESRKILEQIQQYEESKTEVLKIIAEKTKEIEIAERRRALAQKLFEKVQDHVKYHESFVKNIGKDFEELKIDINKIISINFNYSLINEIIEDNKQIIQVNKTLLDAEDDTGLKFRNKKIEEGISALQAQLDAPNVAYQKSLLELERWEEKRRQLEGDSSAEDSLIYLQSLLHEADNIPVKIQEIRLKQVSIAEEIFAEKKGLATIYKKLYAPVQNFINSHPIAKDKLKLEFNAELMNISFTEDLLPLIDQNRKGSFRGLENGKVVIENILGSNSMNDWDSVKKFLEDIEEAFQYNITDDKKTKSLITEQLVKGKKPSDVYNMLYSLNYLEPRYLLKWDNKDLATLSPGERGTLLLIFYLLIDISDVPLIIDQPEGNLDNNTVAKVLVDCIREARERRQVIIVTHNPNLAVVCDADQIIKASLDITNGNKITYDTGALENPSMNFIVTEVLEGTRMAFNIRDAKYEIAE